MISEGYLVPFGYRISIRSLKNIRTLSGGYRDLIAYPEAIWYPA
jgi:hypothetical protein